MTSLRLGAFGLAAITCVKAKRNIAIATKARLNMAAPALTLRGGSLLRSFRPASAPFLSFAQSNNRQENEKSRFSRDLWNLAPERLNVQHTTQHNETEDKKSKKQDRPQADVQSSI